MHLEQGFALICIDRTSSWPEANRTRTVEARIAPVGEEGGEDRAGAEAEAGEMAEDVDVDAVVVEGFRIWRVKTLRYTIGQTVRFYARNLHRCVVVK